MVTKGEREKGQAGREAGRQGGREALMKGGSLDEGRKGRKP